MYAIECRQVIKHYGTNRAVGGASFVLERGQLLALLGPSGCGKTTMLRLMAGLEHPDGGEILISDRVVAGQGVFVPPDKRNVGMVFQDYALFPHMTVEQNIAYGLPRGSQQRVAAMLELVGLGGLEGRYPQQLSGGQQQRVALARALAPQPETILLDEPFSNLDTGLRVQVREEVQRIIQAAGVSAVLVTHDQDEAMSMADQIGVMLGGKVVQTGSPRELYEMPNSAEVMLFLGEANRLTGEGRGEVVETALGLLPLKSPMQGRVEVFIRPENLVLTENGIAAVIERQIYYGSRQTLHVIVSEGTRLTIHVGTENTYGVGEQVKIGVRGKVMAFT